MHIDDVMCLRITFAISCLMLLACQPIPYSQQAIKPIHNATMMNETWSDKHRFFVGFPVPEKFSVCHDLSCHSVSHVSLSANQWSQIEQLFRPSADSPEQERENLKQAIALMEVLVGEQIDTLSDRAKNELHGSRYGQLDCIDEATNTSVYIRLIEQADLFHWHISAPRTGRTLIHGSAPHNTASIIDITSQQRYAVDSWYRANGEPPYIVPMADWEAGWKPNQ